MTGSNEWGTPAPIIALAREVFQGPIDLDPASSLKANEAVGARRFFTVADDGLRQPWTATTVFANPPYRKRRGEAWAADWARRMADEYQAGHFEQGIMVLHNSPSAWLREYNCLPRAYPLKRQNFIDLKTGQPAKNPKNHSVIVYFGRNVDRFRAVMLRGGLRVEIPRPLDEVLAFITATTAVARPSFASRLGSLDLSVIEEPSVRLVLQAAITIDAGDPNRAHAIKERLEAWVRTGIIWKGSVDWKACAEILSAAAEEGDTFDSNMIIHDIRRATSAIR